MSWAFVIPDVDAFPSGGNIFNDRFIKTLQANGVKAAVFTFDQWQLYDEKENYDCICLDSLYVERVNELYKSNANIFLITHHLMSLYPPKGISSKDYFERYERPLLLQFNGFLVTSDFTGKYLCENGIDEKKIFTCLPGLDIMPFEEKKKAQHLEAVIVANIIERKGIFAFLQLLGESIQATDAFHLSILGSLTLEPAYAQKCLDFVQAHPLLTSKVELRGALPQQAVFEAYAKADIFISPSFMETFGMAIQEANAMGLPMLILEGGNSGLHKLKHEASRIFGELEALVDAFLQLTRQKELLESRNDANFQQALSWQARVSQFLADFDQRYTYGKNS